MNKGTGLILLVEDNEKILDINRRVLEGCGYTVLCAETLKEAREYLNDKPDLAVLDIMLPDGNGLEFLSELRAVCKIPVLFLTSKKERKDVLDGLKAGGNDYITKPYRIDEFCARVESALQWEISKREDIQETLTKGSLTMDLLSNRVFIDGKDLLLTDNEFSVLRLLVQNEERVLSADHIYKKVWGQPMIGNNRALQSTISRLRKKINPSGYEISTSYGKGYIFKKI
jgi:DNA-binding response OmpR family regulator